MSQLHNVIVIGGGCAGLTAGIYLARAQLSPIVLVGDLEHKGGLLTKTSVVENFPGFPDGILGYDLMENLESQATKAGCQILEETVTAIKPSSLQPNIFAISTDAGNTYQTKSVIMATGSTPLKLGLPNEDVLWGRGISSCAVCDGGLYKNKRIAVVGGGDSAVEEALYLTKFSDVTMFLRRGEFRASKFMTAKVLAHPKITVVYHTTIVEIHGTTKLESIMIETTSGSTNESTSGSTNESTTTRTVIPVDGLFYGLGLKPNSKLFQELAKSWPEVTPGADVDVHGYIYRLPPNHPDRGETATVIDGIFSAGDVSDQYYRQAVVAAGDGCKAALDVERYLQAKCV